ncbi:MAG TPA: hypothetical protein VFN23_10465 [Ktedonobacteraceae bacterium]|nr:hypothetical protein [Ktedonobacteraceae bacterium]
MQEPRSWRSLLGRIIHDPQERQRIADELGVRPITLTRWVSRESIPRTQNLRHLLSIFPLQQRKLFADLIAEEFKDFPLAPVEDNTQTISSSFYTRLLATNTSTTDILRCWVICSQILQQALIHLDPEHNGLLLTIVRCMPPSNDGKVKSLREYVALGTYPWNTDLEQKAMFLGAESLAGYAVSSCRFATIQSITEGRTLLPAHRVEFEESAAAYPIMRSGRISGCFLVSSVLRNNFVDQEWLDLIQAYTNLLVLAFEPSDFYAPSQIELRIMPNSSIQQSYLTNFRQRVGTTMTRAVHEGLSLNHSQAEQQVWSHLEEELLRLPPPLDED